MKVSTFGTSGMDCLPYDLSMADNAAKPYSADSSTSMEKEDEDHITVPMARIGKAFTPGVVTPTTPKPTDPPKPTEAPTQAPTEPEIILGDADNDGLVTILDVSGIQRHLSGVYLSSFNEKAADVNGDDDVTILDGSWIQRALVGISIPYAIKVD